MSPRLSLTTKVLPSRIFTRSSAIATAFPLVVRGRSRRGAARRSGTMRWNARSRSMSPSTINAPRSTAAIGVLPARCELVEQRLVEADDRIRLGRLPRDLHLTLADRDNQCWSSSPSARSIRTEPRRLADGGLESQRQARKRRPRGSEQRLFGRRLLGSAATFALGAAARPCGSSVSSPSRSTMCSPTRIAFAMAVRAGLTAPMLGKKLVSTT